MKFSNFTLLLLIASINQVTSSATNNLKHVIDECTDGTHDCVAPQICQNIGDPQHAGFLCVCPSGFVENPALQALRHTVPLRHADDYDACHDKVEGDDCTLCDPTNTTCVETADHKHCDAAGVCSAETAPSPAPVSNEICLDVDECLEETDSCTSKQTCENTVGSFTCIDDPEPETASASTWTTFMVYLLGGIMVLVVLLFLILSIFGMSF